MPIKGIVGRDTDAAETTPTLPSDIGKHHVVFSVSGFDEAMGDHGHARRPPATRRDDLWRRL